MNWSGVGIGLKVRVPSEAQIAKAVAAVMEGSSYRQRAQVMAAEMAGLDAARTGADLLERLAGEEPLAKSA